MSTSICDKQYSVLCVSDICFYFICSGNLYLWTVSCQTIFLFQLQFWTHDKAITSKCEVYHLVKSACHVTTIFKIKWENIESKILDNNTKSSSVGFSIQ